VAPNTAYEVSGGLLDLYRLTGEERYLVCSRLMLDQFFANGEDGRPALRYQDGRWVGERSELPADERHRVPAAVSQTGAMLARPALRHDVVTGGSYYRDRLLAWAEAVDERTHWGDQMKADVLLAAHYYSGDPALLARAYAIDLRTWAVVEQDPSTHMCNSSGRYGSKFLMELSYHPLLGGVDWGTRVGLPVERFEHHTAGRRGLPEGLAFRTWRVDGGVEAFEAVNTGSAPASWVISAAEDAGHVDGVQVGDEHAASDGKGYVLRVLPGERVRGHICVRRVGPRVG